VIVGLRCEISAVRNRRSHNMLTELKIGECCNDFGTTTNLSGKSPCELFFVSWVVLTDSLDCIVARDQLERVYAELLVR
jgi:hypothetical protein